MIRNTKHINIAINQEKEKKKKKRLEIPGQAENTLQNPILVPSKKGTIPKHSGTRNSSSGDKNTKEGIRIAVKQRKPNQMKNLRRSEEA